MVLQFWRSEVQHKSHGLKSRCLQGCIPSGGPGENPFPCLFQLLEAACIPWLMAHLLHLQSGQCPIALTEARKGSLPLRTLVIRLGPPG